MNRCQPPLLAFSSMMFAETLRRKARLSPYKLSAKINHKEQRGWPVAQESSPDAQFLPFLALF